MILKESISDINKAKKEGSGGKNVFTVASVCSRLTALSIIVNRSASISILSACSMCSRGILIVRFCFSPLFIVLLKPPSSVVECRCSLRARRRRQKDIFRQQAKVLELPEVITRQSHFRRDCPELYTRKKSLSALSKTS